MDKKLRIAELKKIRKAGNTCGTKDIYYKDENQKMDVFDIPLNCLIFNQLNGRIATFVKTYAKEHGSINAETKQGNELIAEFLWESKKDRNKRTQKDLLQKGQLECGIVTADGVVIDGNRRFMLLKENAEKYSRPNTHFKAIILRDTLADNPKEIMCLETIYQMGVDSKVDYNPIQKYLKCRDLKREDYSATEIAGMMGEKSAADIEKYLNILALMDDYLKTWGYEDMYRILEDQKLEGHFVDLHNYLSKYRDGKGIQDINWVPEDDDIDDLKNAYFDHMRGGFVSMDLRIIANPSKGQGFFTQGEIWKDFAKDHFDKVLPIKEMEGSLDAQRKENPDAAGVDLIRARDGEFADNVEKALKENLGRRTRDLDDRNTRDAPLELLDRAKKTLNSIDPSVEGFECDEVLDISHEIRKIVEGFIKTVNKGKKR